MRHGDCTKSHFLLLVVAYAFLSSFHSKGVDLDLVEIKTTRTLMI